MRKIYLFLIASFLLTGFRLQAQNHSVDVKGFLEYSNTTWAPTTSASWIGFSGIYNRIDFHWYASQQLTFSAGLRTNFDYGSMLAAFNPMYEQYLTQDNGWMDLTFKLASGQSYLLYSNIDRLNFKWSLKKLEVTVGRQRINWGINLVWNPNDIFNTYNYFNFDYVERPGSDAVLVQYYTGSLSSLQLAAKLDNKNRLTAAALYKFNVANYDIQVLGGVMDNDVVLGAGWAGQIKGAGFTGEASYFRNKDHFADSTGQWVVSVGANYTFPNSIFINTSFIYNSKGTTGKAGLRNFFEMGNLSPKTLTLSRMNWFGEVSAQLSPLIKADFSAIVNPYDGSAFLGPSLAFNMTQNLELYVMGQLFTGKPATEYGDFGQMYYLRLKWSF
ncbi:MAG: hypothetical protein JXR71_01760 [Bacteroidales bacterium]|nr:hypothetical protein [Bacteroidales bacterium]